MKSFEKFNVEAMVHHIALKEGMSYDERQSLMEALPLAIPAAAAIGKGLATAYGMWSAYNAAKKLMPQQTQPTPPVDYGQSTVTKAQTSRNQPTGASGAEGSVTARRQAQRAARQQPTGSGSPTPEPPNKPPKKFPYKKSITAAGVAGAASEIPKTTPPPPNPIKAKPEGPPPPRPLNPQSQKAAETIFKLKPGSLEKKPEPEKKEQEPPKPIVAKPEGKPPQPRPIPLNRRRTSPATSTTTGIPVF